VLRQSPELVRHNRDIQGREVGLHLDEVVDGGSGTAPPDESVSLPEGARTGVKPGSRQPLLQWFLVWFERDAHDASGCSVLYSVHYY
jgi:hypothetical protein